MHSNIWKWDGKNLDLYDGSEFILGFENIEKFEINKDYIRVFRGGNTYLLEKNKDGLVQFVTRENGHHALASFVEILYMSSPGETAIRGASKKW